LREGSEISLLSRKWKDKMVHWIKLVIDGRESIWGKRTLFEPDTGKCPQCKTKYAVSMIETRNEIGYPLCSKCKVPLRAVKLRG